ncbi:MAG: tripartite tricarboxylate transporter substrate binding protein [Pseudolabrys sp.]|nr:tripartite tricarboxylate transporter substrate binding protein [Pseudolabrys sp.]
MKTIASGSRNGMRRRDLLAGAAATAAVLVIRPGTANAAGWPDKPVTLVIMYAAGGGTDVIMRLLATEMSKATGWTIEPINKPGAVGGIATNYVLNEQADGYTLLGAANFNKFVRVMGHTKSKQWEDWSTMQAAAAPASWSVRDESPLKSVDDVVKFAKANPGKLTISTSGTGGIWHEVAMQIADALDIKVQFIPYKGGKPAALAGLQGETMIAGGGVPEHIDLIRSGKMRNLFQCGSQDIKLADNKVLHSIGNLVPATKSILPVGSTYNLMMRRTVPAAVQKEVTAAFVKAAGSPAFKAVAEKKYFELQVLTGEAADKRAAQLETNTAHLFNQYRDQVGGKVVSAKELGLPEPKDFDKWWPPQGYKPVGA